jgi:hypothetical protein
MFGDWETLIRSQPLSHIAPDLPFLHRYVQFFNPKKNILEKVITFGHPVLMRELRNKKFAAFIDCTFANIPVDFEQLLIFMVYSNSSDLYLPVNFTLLQSKTEEAYLEALSSVIISNDYHSNINTFTCDYEIGLMKACFTQFGEEVENIGCLFHFKQAIRAKMISHFRIPDSMVSEFIGEKGLFNLLTVIPINEIETKGKIYVIFKYTLLTALSGIPYIQYNFDVKEYTENFNLFWIYFTKTWLGTYSPESWNINRFIHYDKKGELIPNEDLINRTNNALERCNRELHAAFNDHGHKSMNIFVETLKKFTVSYVEKRNQVYNNRYNGHKHRDVTVFQIPNDYYPWIPVDQSRSNENLIISNYNK